MGSVGFVLVRACRFSYFRLQDPLQGPIQCLPIAAEQCSPPQNRLEKASEFRLYYAILCPALLYHILPGSALLFYTHYSLFRLRSPRAMTRAQGAAATMLLVCSLLLQGCGAGFYQDSTPQTLNSKPKALNPKPEPTTPRALRPDTRKNK